MARKSQVPDPSGPVTSLLHMLGLLSPVFQTCHMGRSYSASPNLPEHFAGPRAREDSPHLTLLSSHRSISKLNISHFNFLPAPLFLAHGSYLFSAAVFQLTFKLSSYP